MSLRTEKIKALTSLQAHELSDVELLAKYKKNLKEGMHGICFSPYVEGQQPGDQLSAEQIERRIKILKPYTGWVRSFSCTEGNELIPKIAKEHGLKTLVGAWLGTDREINRKELDGLISLCQEGLVDIAAVGNEVMYREDLTESELLETVREVKQSVSGVPVGYVDAYYEFRDRPAITELCDVVLANCYPFWEGCPIEYSLLYMKEMYSIAEKAASGKKVIITETGWPSKGTSLEGSVPSDKNFMQYFINAQEWSREDGVEMFYFSSFDESWKVGAEGDVGAYWGIWDKNEEMKY